MFILMTYWGEKGEEWEMPADLTVDVVCMFGSHEWNIFLIQSVSNGFAQFPSFLVMFLDKQSTYRFWWKNPSRFPFIHTWNTEYFYRAVPNKFNRECSFWTSFSIRQTGQVFTSGSYLSTNLTWFLLSLLYLYQKSNKSIQKIDTNSGLKVQYRIEIDNFIDDQNGEKPSRKVLKKPLKFSLLLKK